MSLRGLILKHSLVCPNPCVSSGCVPHCVREMFTFKNLLLRGDNSCSEADLGSTVLKSHSEQNIYPVFHSDQFQPTLYTVVGQLVTEEARQPLLER